MTGNVIAREVHAVYRKCADLRERANGDGTFTIDGVKMMALIELHTA